MRKMNKFKNVEQTLNAFKLAVEALSRKDDVTLTCDVIFVSSAYYTKNWYSIIWQNLRCPWKRLQKICRVCLTVFCWQKSTEGSENLLQPNDGSGDNLPLSKVVSYIIWNKVIESHRHSPCFYFNAYDCGHEVEERISGT